MTYKNNNTIIHERFKLEDLTIKSRKKLLQNFLTRLKELNLKEKEKSIILFHWGSHERTVFYKNIKKYNINISSYLNKTKLSFIDGCSIFKSEPIIVKGALNFSIKTIGNALYELKLIDCIWDKNTRINSGEDAMYFAWKHYNGNASTNNEIMDEIDNYNEKDCLVLYKIFEEVLINYI